MGQDRGLMDGATPHCEKCARPLERQDTGDDSWECVNASCERRGETLTIAT